MPKAERLAEAGLAYEQALALARDGATAASRVWLSAASQTFSSGRDGSANAIEMLRLGEALLRELSDREVLAPLLCIRGRAEVAVGERARAGATLAEAEAMATAMGATPDTELGRGLAALRAALA